MAEPDYYNILGVARDATPEQIQKAYRDLARKYHPDLHPDDKEAKKKFQQVQLAFETLNDAQKRELYNRYGAGYESVGAGRGPGGPGGQRPGWSGGPGGQGYQEFDLNDLFGGGGGEGGGFADMFRNFTGGGGSAGPRGGSKRAARGSDLATELEIPFATAILGGEVEVGVSPGNGPAKTIGVKIPAGVEEGQQIRLRGQGAPGPRGGQAGDLLLTLHVAAHPFFQRRGDHLDVKAPITLAEAALGATIDLPTPKGVIALRIPAGTSSGAKLRVKGYGVAKKGATPGDLFAEVQIVIPKKIDDADRELIQKLDEHWRSEAPLDPRRDLRW